MAQGVRMPDVGTTIDPLSGDVILALVASLGLSTVAGLRAAAVLFAVGLAYDIHIGGQPLLPLHGAFQVLGSPWMLTILGILMVAEFIVDKFPGLDHVNDIIATVVRPVVGATIAAGTTNVLSNQSIWVAAVVGAILAFSTHAVKAGTRAVSTATTAGVANPLLSVGEDILTVGSAVLLIVFTVVGVILAVITVGLVVGVFFWALGKRRKARQRRQLAQSRPQPALNQPVTQSGYLLTTPQGVTTSQIVYVPTYIPASSGPVGVPPQPAPAALPQTATMYPPPYATPQSVPSPVSQSAPSYYNSFPGYGSPGYGAYQGPTSQAPFTRAPADPMSQLQPIPTVPTMAYPPTASYPLDAPTQPGQNGQNGQNGQTG